MWPFLCQALDDVVYRTHTVEQFEQGWKSMVDEFGLATNKWVNKMYRDRMKWSPVYFRHQFWAGMSSTQRSEGMNNFFRGYFNENTTLLQFAEQYNLAHAKRVEAEAEATFASHNRPVVCKTTFPWEEQIRSVYTSNKFIEFQKQLCNVQYQVETLERTDGETREYVVADSSHRSLLVSPEGWNYRVVYNRASSEVMCICKKFEFRGILCKHALRIFQREGIWHIPQRYVLDRWRKDLPRDHKNYSVPLYPPIARRRKPSAYISLRPKFKGIAELVLGDTGLTEEFNSMLDTLKRKAEEKKLTNHTFPPAGREADDSLSSDTETTSGTMKIGMDDACRKRKQSAVVDPPDRRTRGRTRKYRHGHWKKKARKESTSSPKKQSKKGSTSNSGKKTQTT